MKKTAILIIASLVLLGFLAIPAISSPETDKGPLEKITFIHYKKDKQEVKELSAKGKAPNITCYAFLSSGAKWKNIEPYLINPSNSNSLSESFVANAVNSGVSEWEKYGGNIFGSASIDYTATDPGMLDGKNTVTFGTYNDPNVIAITTVWGYFGGSPKTRQLIEWDMLFNDTYFQFGDAAANPALMDLQDIATHELGHSAGMNDLYNTVCSAETMYGYASEGEVSKRTLNSGDIKGIQTLYK